MAIRPITSAVFSNNYNQINFSGKRRNTENSQNSGLSLPPFIKTASLAAVLAMSPMVSIAQDSSTVLPNVSKTQHYSLDENDKLIGLVVDNIPKEVLSGITGNFGVGNIAVYDSDNDESTYEKLVISLLENQTDRLRQIFLNGLCVEKHKDKNGKEYLSYKLIGSTQYKNLKTGDVKPSTTYVKMKKESFEYFKELLGDDFPVEVKDLRDQKEEDVDFTDLLIMGSY